MVKRYRPVVEKIVILYFVGGVAHVARDSHDSIIHAVMVEALLRCRNLSFVARILHDGWISIRSPRSSLIYLNFLSISAFILFRHPHRRARIINDERVLVARLNWVTVWERQREKERGISSFENIVTNIYTNFFEIDLRSWTIKILTVEYLFNDFISSSSSSSAEDQNWGNENF